MNKNAYEIRTDILGMAKELVTQDFEMNWRLWEMSVKRDEHTGQVLSRDGAPQRPTIDEVLKAAERLYSFVDSK